MKKTVKILITAFCVISIVSGSLAFASPYVERGDESGGYFEQTGRKFMFGLKNSLLGWAQPWLEAEEKSYSKPWNGYMVGWGKAVVYTAGGLIHLVTFPIPVDFPDIEGVHLPNNKKKKAANHAVRMTAVNSVQPSSETYEDAFGDEALPPANSTTSSVSVEGVPGVADTRKQTAMEAALQEVRSDEKLPSSAMIK